MLQVVLITVTALLAIVVLVLGARALGRRIIAGARARAAEIESEAENQAEFRLKEVDLEIQEQRSAAEAQFEAQTRKKRQELRQLEERLRDQEHNLQRRLQLLSQKQREADQRESRVKEREAALGEAEGKAQALLQERRQSLERVAGMTAAQARRELTREIEADARQEAVHVVRRIEEEAREEAASRVRRVAAEALQRVPTRELYDEVVTIVQLPNDDMKGRIIGREGRNIRAIEMATGVDLIVDETPQAIVLSSHDPFRRAIAQTALERLIEDGRIHPGRIEEVVAKARSETEHGLETSGEAAAFELGITGLPSRLTRLLGKLKHRLVMGYNLLDHSIDVARTAQQMAVLLGARSEVVLRAGLLHEIGQVEEGEGLATHPLLISADLAARFGEDDNVAQAIRSMNDEASDASVEATLLKTADRLVVARPGARDDNLDAFVERLHHLEDIALSFDKVDRAFAMRAGREVRIIAEAGSASDSDIIWLSKDITKRIEQELSFPGSVRVSVIRETRAVDYAT